jgi:cell division protein FtsW
LLTTEVRPRKAGQARRDRRAAAAARARVAGRTAEDSVASPSPSPALAALPRLSAAPGTTGPAVAPARPAARPSTAASKGGSFWLLVFLVSILCLIGVVMVLSASSILSLSSYGTPWHYFLRQWIWLSIGWGGFYIAYRVNHERWRRLCRLGMIAVVGLLLAVLVPGIGVSANGASRWIGNSTVQIQPSELAKLALVFFGADILERRQARGNWRYQAAPVIVVLLLLVVLVMAQPDMGTTLVLVAIVGAMLFTAGMPGRSLALLGACGLTGAFVMAKAAPYRWRRMTAFLHPFKDARNTGYQPVQGLLALSHGHVLGEGIGSSLASYGYLPNAQTDYIFAVIGEETGMIGGFFVSALFVMLMLVGVKVACRAGTRFAALTAAGITAWLVSQAVINIGAVVGLLPVTGVPLPFVSFGGSALVISLFGVGVLANIAKGS